MTKYVFDHFELNGEVYGGPQIAIKMMGDATLKAIYIEETVPPPPTDYSKYLLPIIIIGANILKKKD